MTNTSWRGRAANTPAQLPFKGWKDIFFRVKDEVAADRVGLIAAGVAFYGFLAIFPPLRRLWPLVDCTLNRKMSQTS